MIARKILIPLTLLFITFSCAPKKVVYKPQANYNLYIAHYSQLAMKQQQKYQIPASITLAQGLLESGAGASRLAVQANNHFGIKCHDWTGASISHDDDAKGECFRKYKYVEDSYEDHSLFLAKRSRYAALFDLTLTDYKGWARGLKKCGYATDPAYADKLIRVIETYNLQQYDTMWKGGKAATAQQQYGLKYVVLQRGDRLVDVAQIYKIKLNKLYEYNDLLPDYKPVVGDMIYLEQKNRRASKENSTHVVAAGESLHSIAQNYGVRIKYIYRMNRLKEHSHIEVGDVLKLR